MCALLLDTVTVCREVIITITQVELAIRSVVVDYRHAVVEVFAGIVRDLNRL